MPDSSERDEKLVGRGYVVGVNIFRGELREWIQEEIIACKIAASMLEPTVTGVLKTQVSEICRRLDEINNSELRGVIENFDTKCKEIEAGVWDDVLDVRPYLEECLSRVETLVRELLRIRHFLDNQLD